MEKIVRTEAPEWLKESKRLGNHTFFFLLDGVKYPRN